MRNFILPLLLFLLGLNLYAQTPQHKQTIAENTHFQHFTDVSIKLTSVKADTVDTLPRPYNLTAYIQNRGVGLSWIGNTVQYQVQCYLGTDTVLNVTTSTRSYTISNLDDGTYTWRVRGCNYDMDQFSVWVVSDFKIVGTGTTSVNDDTNIEVFGARGYIAINNANDAKIDIFDVTGRLICEQKSIANNHDQVPIRSGVYIVRIDKKMYKVMVR